MTIETLIEQLESLIDNQKDFIAGDETGVFERDVEALEIAINIIKNHEDDLRVCSDCGKIMNEGFCIENGLEYYCSDECLHKHYTEDEYLKMYDDGNGDSYYTEWED